jgi:hypothetical protein
LLLGALAGGLSAQDKKPERIFVEADYIPPPETLEGFFQSTTAVALVQIESREQQFSGKGVKARPFIVHTARVIKVFRSDSADIGAGRTIQIRQPGGTVVSDGVEVTARDRSFPVLGKGDQYYVFLKRGTSGLSIASGPAGAFAKKEQSVTIHLSRLFGGKRTMSPNEFDATLERLRK